jgi:predicted DNA-binding protein (MmcQ/YjbR family)
VNYKEFNKFCRSLPATTYVIHWGGSHVWKVGGKVFAIGGWQEDAPSFTFKVSDIAYEMLKEQPGLRPAPYLASRGMKWIQHFAKPGLSDAGLRRLYPPVACDCFAEPVEEEAHRARAGTRGEMNHGAVLAHQDEAKCLLPQNRSRLG